MQLARHKNKKPFEAAGLACNDEGTRPTLFQVFVAFAQLEFWWIYFSNRDRQINNSIDYNFSIRAFPLKAFVLRVKVAATNLKGNA